MNVIKRTFKQIGNFFAGRKVSYSAHQYNGNNPYKQPAKKARKKKKNKMRGFDGTMFGPYRSSRYHV
jgi:hypothetical protein